MDERRTYPGFLSKDEAARDARRLQEMVRGFEKFNPVSRIGETENFIIDYDCAKKIVLVYGKEIPAECHFKLGFDESETCSIINLLVKAQPFFKKR